MSSPVALDEVPEERGHVVQFYEDDAYLTDSVARFLGSGLGAGDAVVVIATGSHLESIGRLLRSRGLDLAAACDAGRYIALEASATLSRLMVDGHPDEGRFAEVVGGVVARAADAGHAGVRVFGEMIAVLWSDGRRAAAVRLEQLWNELGARVPFSLLCAYPIHAFRNGDDDGPFLRVCGEHSHVIPAESYPALATPDERLRLIGRLQQKAEALEADAARRRELDESQGRLAAIIESSDDAIVGKTLDGIVTSWNGGAERIFGYRAEEMIGQPIARLIPADRPDDLHTILSAIRRGERVSHFETERIRKDGERIRVSLTVSPIRDASGRIIGASKIARDVTERSRAEQTLRETTDILETLNRTSTILSAELELEKVVQTVVDAATGLTGARFGVFVHNEGTIHAVAGVPPVTAARGVGSRALELFARTLRGKGVVRLDDLARLPRFRGTANSLRIRSYLAAPVVSRGAVIGGLFFGHPDPDAFAERDERLVVGLAAQAAIAIDNARLYEAEHAARLSAEAASRAKDEFLSVVSHELRTPLSPILTWTRMLREHRLGEDKKARALATIERCARTQAQLIEDLLDVSRIIAGKLRLEMRPVRLTAVLEAAIDVVRPAAEAKAIRIRIVADPDVGTIVADAERIQQVVWNLLSNAIKFTPEQGGVTVALERDGSSARIVVEDTGKGIARDLLPHVFERFRQGDTSASRAYGGLGLGLAIVRHLVEAHGGTVAARSAGEGHGATFTVRLPRMAARVAAAGAPAGPPTTRPSVADYPSLAGLRVLVVDDEADSSEAVRELLASCDADVEVAESAERARDVLSRWDADVLVSDVGMPREDGFDFIASLRRREDGGAPPAVALTAYASRADKIRLLAAGFQAHVPKPVDGAELVRVVADVARSSGRL